MKTQLARFDLEAAKAGKMISTRNGRQVEFVTVLTTGGQVQAPAPLLMKVSYYRETVKGMEQFWTMENYYLSGRYLPPHEHPMDLFMSDNPGWQ
jgi:hypothetical protein